MVAISTHEVDLDLNEIRNTATQLGNRAALERAIDHTDDAAFLRRRHRAVLDELDAAQTLIAQLLQRIDAYEATNAPDAVRHAMSSPTGSVHPIDVDIDGQTLTIGVPGLGLDDHTEIDNRWRQLLNRYRRPRGKG